MVLSMGSPGSTVVKNQSANAGGARDVGLMPGSGRSPGEGNGNPLQYSCLENSMDRGAWWVTVHGVAKSNTSLKSLSTMHTQIYVYTFMHTHTCIFMHAHMHTHVCIHMQSLLKLAWVHFGPFIQ